MKSKAILMTAAGAVVVLGGTVGGIVATAQSGSSAATDSLNALATKGPDTAIVAVVDGQPIYRRAIDIGFAVSAQPGVEDVSGRPLASASKEQLLEHEIEEVLLAQAAVKAGVQVSDDDVTLAINSGIVGPLTSPSTPEDVRKPALAALAAAGVTVENAVTDPTVRASYVSSC